MILFSITIVCCVCPCVCVVGWLDGWMVVWVHFPVPDCTAPYCTAAAAVQNEDSVVSGRRKLREDISPYLIKASTINCCIEYTGGYSGTV